MVTDELEYKPGFCLLYSTQSFQTFISLTSLCCPSKPTILSDLTNLLCSKSTIIYSIIKTNLIHFYFFLSHFLYKWFLVVLSKCLSKPHLYLIFSTDTYPSPSWENLLSPGSITAHTFCGRILLKLKFPKGGRESPLYKSKMINSKETRIRDLKIFPCYLSYCLAFKIELVWLFFKGSYGQVIKMIGLAGEVLVQVPPLPLIY